MDEKSLESLTDCLYDIASSIAHVNSPPWEDKGGGGVVGNVVEAGISISLAIRDVSSAISDLADAIRSHGAAEK